MLLRNALVMSSMNYLLHLRFSNKVKLINVYKLSFHMSKLCFSFLIFYHISRSWQPLKAKIKATVLDNLSYINRKIETMLQGITQLPEHHYFIRGVIHTYVILNLLELVCEYRSALLALPGICTYRKYMF